MRLIDADALRAAMYHEAFENDASYDEKNPLAKWDSGLWVRYKMFESCLESAPSIDAVPHWIPCEERLPKHGEYVFVYLFGDNPYIAWYNENRKQWDTDEFGIDKDEEPVAWMPLPEPYERKES